MKTVCLTFKIMIMKKIYFLIASAIVVAGFTACTQNDFIEGTPEGLSTAVNDNSIQFGTYLGKTGSTRTLTNGGSTGAINTEGLKSGSHSEGFGVFGYSSTTTFTDGTAVSVAPNFMYNQQVTWSSDVWTYSPLKYWPNGIDGNNAAGSPSNTATQDESITKLNFYAYAPYIADVDETGITLIPDNTATNLKFGYKLPTTQTETNSVDLLWGLRNNTSGYGLADGTESDGQKANAYNVNLTKQNTTEKVSFLFKHALAKIGGYNATTSKGGLKVVADFGGNGAGMSGYGNKDANTLITINSVVIKDVIDGTSTMYVSGDFDISTGTWSSQVRSTATTAQTLVNLTATDINEGVAEHFEGIYPSATETNNVVSSWKRDESNNLEGVTTTAKNVYKTNADGFFLIPGIEGQQLEVTVKYNVRTYDNKLSGNMTNIQQTIKNNVTLPALEVNKYYTLVMHLGLTSVKFTAEVSDWEDAETGGGSTSGSEVIWLPSNVVDATSTTSTTLANGKGQTVYVDAAQDSYTLTVSNIISGKTFNVVKSGANISSVSPENGTGDGNDKTITVSLSKNFTNKQVTAGTVTVTDADGNITTLTIIQKADATFTLSSGTPEKISKDNNTGGVITLAKACAVSIAGSDKVTVSDGFSVTMTDGDSDSHYETATIKASSANNSGSDTVHTIILTITGSDSNTYTYTTTITQAGS